MSAAPARERPSKMRVYNTYTRLLEEFKPITPGKVRMYNCGPTVYNYATIGNFRAYIFADVLRRSLEYFGNEVTQIVNITDVGHMTSDADEGEDKMSKAAREQKKDPWQIAEFYMNAFFDDIKTLNIQPAQKYPRATEHVAEMIAIVAKLIENGHAYVTNGNVYYDVSSFPGYGRLSGNTLEQLNAGARIEVNPEKRNPQDFALWKQDPKHIMQWDSPWGRGFPGWHIECSAMSSKYLGDQFDIHTGGEEFLDSRAGEAGAVGGILAVGDDHLDAAFAPHPRHHARHRLAPRFADNITDEEDFHFAYSMTRVSRTTVTLIWPGYWSSCSILRAI